MSRKLVAFYSRADENYVSGQIRTLETGNTEVAAAVIAKLTGADLFQIEQQIPYARDYNECIAQAQDDQKRDARPALKALPEHWEDYDVIYLGYPNYWSTMPMAVFTFLEQLNFGQKTIYPFCTHEGSGMGSSLEDIQKICPQAKLGKELALRGGSVGQSEARIRDWLEHFSNTL